VHVSCSSERFDHKRISATLLFNDPHLAAETLEYNGGEKFYFPIRPINFKWSRESLMKLDVELSKEESRGLFMHYYDTLAAAGCPHLVKKLLYLYRNNEAMGAAAGMDCNYEINKLWEDGGKLLHKYRSLD